MGMLRLHTVEECQKPMEMIGNHMQLIHGDCLEVLRGMPDNSVDAVVTDPPYGLSFMGKKWDYDVPSVEIWQECLRVLKPGGHLLAFAGTRTQHRMAVRIEDAGFEIRDMIGYLYSTKEPFRELFESLNQEQKKLLQMALGGDGMQAWCYGSGFPKSLDISKKLDLMEKDKYLQLCKAIDNLVIPDIITEWKRYLRSAKTAGVKFQKNPIEIGMNTQKNDFVLLNAAHLHNLEKSNVNAIIAELNLNAHHPMRGAEVAIAQESAEVSIEQLQSLVRYAEKSRQNQSLTYSPISIAECNVRELLNERTAQTIKVEEALETWNGKGKYLGAQGISALCVALTENLRRIILSQSRTFLSLGMTQQTEFASAITVIITEYTAESLTSFMVGILKNKAIDNAAGAEREVIGLRTDGRGKSPQKINNHGNGDTGIGHADGSKQTYLDTAPATDAAKQWAGWGTALKPALEPITVARKPLSEKTVAANALKWGTGGINVDGCRVGHSEPIKVMKAQSGGNKVYGQSGRYAETTELKPVGRFPANLIHDGSEEVLAGFPVTTSGALNSANISAPNGTYGKRPKQLTGEYAPDTGSAARFFYCAKASKSERDAGCEGFDAQKTTFAAGTGLSRNGDGTPRNQSPSNRNHHPTVKPLALMRYLCRLITPPGGIVLDPFMGSGSTGKAALSEGFGFIGIERDPEYFEIARARIAAIQDKLI